MNNIGDGEKQGQRRGRTFDKWVVGQLLHCVSYMIVEEATAAMVQVGEWKYW